MPSTRAELVIALLGLALIGALVALSVPAWNDYRDANAEAAKPARAPSAEEPIAVKSRPSEAQTGSSSASEPTATIAPARVRLRVTATRGDSWVVIRAGQSSGKVLYARILGVGRTIEYRRPKLWLELGAPANVDLVLNGRPASFAAEATTFVVTRRGVRQA
jgi:uncharacterized protein DUF4115